MSRVSLITCTSEQVVTVISRDTLLILDPSSKYLPPGPRGQKRSALTRKITDISRYVVETGDVTLVN
jgi:hypothetical protein